MANPALISPYPGGKGGPRYFRKFGGHVQSLICDRPHHYDCIVEPFAGSGAVTWQHSHGIKNAIAADVDPGVLAVWRCWGDETLSKGVTYWLEILEMLVKDAPDKAFNQIKAVIDAGSNSYDQDHFAANYLAFKRLVFGGVLRCNTQGKLNVALSQDKLEKYLNGWQYTWPDNGIENLTVEKGWQGAVKALADSDYENALVVIDAPYWTPGKRMTEAYTHHGDPGSDEVMRLTTDCLDAVLATGKAGRVVVFNYYSGELDDEIRTVQERYLNELQFCLSSDLGPLKTMNNGQGTDCHEYYSESAWEIGGKRMFRDHDAVEQLCFV